MFDDENSSRRTPEVLTVPDLMNYLAIGKTTAYKLLAKGKIKSFRIGRNHKIPRRSVEEYIEKESGGRHK